MSEFITILPPPGDTIAEYDPTKRSSEQSSSIPQAFLDAMSVRETVFVDEQEVPLVNELDPDDARSWHWVVYASVGRTKTPSPTRKGSTGNAAIPNGTHEANNINNGERRTSDSTAARVAVATIRLVPPPHPPHPQPGSHHKTDNADAIPPVTHTRRTSLHDGHEPYIKLGRLATLKEYRGKGLSKLLVSAALRWAMEHSVEILPPPEPAAAEAARLEGEDEEDWRWRGLVLVHAQLDRTVGLWERYGFSVDERMGIWDEEGIPHIGMWRRLEVKK